MTTKRRLAIVISLMLVAAPVFAADAFESATVHVRIINRAGVSRWVLGPAENQVTRIYAASGIQIVWVAESPSPSGGRTIRHVLLLSPSMSDRMIVREKIPRFVLGWAIRDAGRAFIFTDRALTLAAGLGVDGAGGLGVVIGHELGHLLLPDGGHSATGLMQSSYDCRHASARRFTPAQTEAMRQRLVSEQSQ